MVNEQNLRDNINFDEKIGENKAVNKAKIDQIKEYETIKINTSEIRVKSLDLSNLIKYFSVNLNWLTKLYLSSGIRGARLSMVAALSSQP